MIFTHVYSRARRARKEFSYLTRQSRVEFQKMNKGAPSHTSKAARLRSGVKRLWSLRHRYTYFRDWLFSIYHRLLMRLPRLPLPARHSVRRVRLKGIEEPFYVRLGTTDWYVLEEIFFDVTYQPLVERITGEVRQIIDLGANTGFSTRLWQLQFPDARIIAVEPDGENMKMCRLNILNGTENPPQLVQACVSGVARQVSLDRTEGSWRFTMREATQSETELIPALTLQQIMDECRMHGTIDFIKCNIEGAEAEVFARCGGWIGQVKKLAIQLHPPYTLERLQEDLRRSGGHFTPFEVAYCDDGSEMVFLEQSDK